LCFGGLVLKYSAKANNALTPEASSSAPLYIFPSLIPS